MLQKSFLLVLSLLFSSLLYGQLEIRVTFLPIDTPEGANIYVAGNFNNWSPGDSDYILEPNDEGIYSIVIYPPIGTVSFKFTRGSWETVEGNALGQYQPNHELDYTGTPVVSSVPILSWENQGSGNSTASSNVSVLSTSFYMPQLDRNRRIWLYLPPDYDDTSKTYPVLYMHDGQNLFDATTSFAGEWEIDESLNRLFEAGDSGIIVIGIDNGGGDRLDELTPWSNPQYGGGDGDKYVQFIVETLKPFIDKHFRTRPDQANTGIMGSSLGGLISMYAAIEHQDVFGRAGIFSPSFWYSQDAFIQVSSTGKEKNMRFYLQGGQTEGGNMLGNLNAMYNTLLDAGFSEEEIFFITHQDGQHSEWYWRREFPAAYEWLFANNITSTNQVSERLVRVQISPNPASELLKVELSREVRGLEAKIINIDGKEVQARKDVRQNKLDVSNLEAGAYIILFFSRDKLLASKKLFIE